MSQIAPAAPLITLGHTIQGTRTDLEQIALSNGNQLFIWTEDSAITDNNDVMGQIYSPDMQPLGAAFRINTETEAQQDRAQALALPDGGFVVVWESFGQDHFNPPGFFQEQRFTLDSRDSHVSEQHGVYLQRFAADGTPDGVETLVNRDHVSGDQRGAQIIGLSDGGYVVTWNNTNWVSPDFFGRNMFLQRFDAAGNFVSDNKFLETEFDVNLDGTIYADLVPYNLEAGIEVAPGTLAFVWSSFLSAGSFLFFSDFEGRLQNTVVLPDGDNPPLTLLTDGSLALAWSQDGQIFGAIHDTSGAQIVAAFPVSDAEGFIDITPQVTALPDGTFLVAWFSFANRAVEARIMGADGSALGDIVQLTPEGSDVDDWDIEVTATGGIQISWESGVTNQMGFSPLFLSRTFTIESNNALTEIGDGGVNQSFGPIAAIVLGGNGDDTLSGSPEADVFSGSGGDDSLLGNAGDDHLTGDAGSDTINGGSGSDLLDGSNGRDLLRGGTGGDALFGGVDNDTLAGQDGDDLLVAGYHIYGNFSSNESDRLVGGEGDDTLVAFEGGSLDGGPGNDLIFGPGAVVAGDGDDTVTNTRVADGGPGYDILITQAFGIDLVAGSIFSFGEPSDTNAGDISGFEAFVMVSGSGLVSKIFVGDDQANTLYYFDSYLDAQGGAGDDAFISLNTVGLSREGALSVFGVVYDTEIYGGPGNDTILGGLQDNAFFGDGGNDWIEGHDYRDTIRGGQGNDTLFGGDENDRLFGSAGDDVQDGGPGTDFLDGGIGADTLSGGIGDDTIDGQEGDDVITGGDGVDTALIAGNLLDSRIFQMGDGALRVVTTDGEDTLTGIEFIQFDDTTVEADLYANGHVISGTPGPNMLTADAGPDTLRGAGGNDTLDAGTGSDSAEGGVGFDLLLGDTGDDTLRGNNGYDTLVGEAGNDQLFGNFGLDQLFGGRDDDTLAGGLGPDTLWGELGNDLVQGNQGADSAMGGYGDDTLQGNAGADTLDGGFGNDLLEGGINNDLLLASWNDDTLDGGAGSDVLFGQAGDNVLNGNSGSDTLHSGRGDDTMTGGIGADTFVFANLSHKNDVVTDFQPGIDTLEFAARFIETLNVDPATLAQDMATYFHENSDGDLEFWFATSARTITFEGITDPDVITDAIVFV